MKAFVSILAAILVYLPDTIHAQWLLVSDTTWAAGFSQNGPTGLKLYDVGTCVDEARIDMDCGPGYGSPDLEAHFAGCTDIQFIWPERPPANCKFTPGTYWFTKEFDLPASDPCRPWDNPRALVQADNNFRFFLNGQLLRTSNDAQWNEVFSIPMQNALTGGRNRIDIEVSNVNGGDCFNYAFMGFCMSLSRRQISYDATFTATVSNCSDYCIQAQGNADYNGTNVSQKWYLIASEEDCPPTAASLIPVLQSSGSSFYSGPLPSGYCYWLYRQIEGPCGNLCEVQRFCPDRFNPTICPSEPNISCETIKALKFSDENCLIAFFTMLPNPAYETVDLTWECWGNVSQVAIFNAEGKWVYSLYPGIFDDRITLQVRDLPPALYLVRLTAHSGKTFVKKLIVATYK
jgi:hypothetical protein